MQPSFKLLATLMTAALLSITGCGGGGDSTPAQQASNQESVGPISGAEFAAVPPPTFQQFLTAYAAVTTTNPGLLNDETALSRTLFAEVKRTSTANGRNQPQALNVKQLSLWSSAERLTIAEWKLVILHPIMSYTAAGTVDLSLQTAQDTMPCDVDVQFRDGKADAVRHAYWNALMAKRTTTAFAEAFGTAHESGGTNEASATAMDLHNNLVGRTLAEKYPTATEAQLLELILEQTFTLFSSGTQIPANTVGLVYISSVAKRPFDGTFTGSVTNPDSGGPWNATFNISQCGTTVRGNLVITRGTERQERRFNGTSSGDTGLSLAISDPYAFEDPRGLSYCTAMRTTLSGRLNQLSGDWTASNCPLGGVVLISRP